MRLTAYRALVGCVLVWGSLSCHSGTDFNSSKSEHIADPGLRIPPYEWGFANRGNHDIGLVYITWTSGRDTFSAGAGYLGFSSWGEAADNEGWDPIPEHVTMTWREDDTNKSEVITVASRVPDLKHFSGTILFVYDGKDWHLKFKPAAKISGWR